MSVRIFAVMFIFIISCFAWWILGISIFERTNSASSRLKGSVESTWGEQQVASPPVAMIEYARDPKTTIEQTLPLESTEAKAAVDLAHRQKGLLWYSTYRVAFSGTYAYTNPFSAPHGRRRCRRHRR